jgi:hypothetical protein
MPKWKWKPRPDPRPGAPRRAVIEVANSRWDSDSFACYLLDGASVTKLDLRAPVVKAKLPAHQREFNSCRVREDLPLTLDSRGHARFTAMVYVPKSEPTPGLRNAGRHFVGERQAVGAARLDAVGEVGLVGSCGIRLAGTVP